MMILTKLLICDILNSRTNSKKGETAMKSLLGKTVSLHHTSHQRGATTSVSGECVEVDGHMIKLEHCNGENVVSRKQPCTRWYNTDCHGLEFIEEC